MIFVVIILVFIFIVAASVKVVSQSNKYIVERYGKYSRTLEAGIHFLTPIVDTIALKIDIREQVVNFPPQPVITKDNVTMQIDTVIYVSVTNPYDYRYNVGDPIKALENLTATTLRNIIGELELDSTLTSRDIINSKIRITLDEATESWGMKVNRVEVKNILPPADIQQAMEKQMRAEREKREKILIAEGNKTASITQAEGLKASTILRAEADKEQAILRAQGEAQAILAVQTAYAESLRLLNEAAPEESVLKLKGYEAIKEIGQSTSSKLIIPSDIGNLASIGAIFNETKKLSNEGEEKKA